MKRVFAVLVVLVFVAGGFFAYKAYSQRQLVAALQPHLKDASVRVGNILITFKGGADDKETLKSFHKRLDSDMEEIEQQMAQVLIIAKKDRQHLTEPVLSYMRECRVFINASKDFSFNAYVMSEVSAAGDRQIAMAAALELASAEERQTLPANLEKTAAHMRVMGKSLTNDADRQIESLKRLKEIRSTLTKYFSSDSLLTEEALENGVSNQAALVRKFRSW